LPLRLSCGSVSASPPNPGSDSPGQSPRDNTRSGLIVRLCVSRSTATNPNLGRYPIIHSKLSSSGQWMYPRTSMPSAREPLQPCQRPPRIFDAPRIVLRAHAILGDVDRRLHPRTGIPHARFQRLGPEFITHLRKLDSGLRSQIALRSDAAPRVRLHAQKIALRGSRQPEVVHLAAFPVPLALGPAGLFVLNRDAEARGMSPPSTIPRAPAEPEARSATAT
jgi:hypothetical protein